MSDDLLLVERQGPVALLTLNNPTRLNSLVRPLRDALAETVPKLAADPEIRVVVLTGAGRGFCSGGDFSQPRDKARPVLVHREMSLAHGWIRALLGSETLVVTAVNGPAAGAGFGLAMMGDVVLASDQAFFKAGFPTIGVSADYLLGWTLPRAVGFVRAFDIVTSNRRIDVTEAERIGMITRVVPADVLLETALETAQAMARGPYSLGLTKRLVRRAHDLSLDDYMQSEVFSFALATASDDYSTGGEAFRRKEAPVFEGR